VSTPSTESTHGTCDQPASEALEPHSVRRKLRDSPCFANNGLRADANVRQDGTGYGINHTAATLQHGSHCCFEQSVPFAARNPFDFRWDLSGRTVRESRRYLWRLRESTWWRNSTRSTSIKVLPLSPLPPPLHPSEGGRTLLALLHSVSASLSGLRAVFSRSALMTTARARRADAHVGVAADTVGAGGPDAAGRFWLLEPKSQKEISQVSIPIVPPARSACTVLPYTHCTEEYLEWPWA
jgi:hypothetical protein